MREHPEALTVAYIALGVAEWIDRKGGAALNFGDWSGEVGFVQAVIDHAALVDTVGDAFNESGHPGVFAYEVAQTFGTEFAEALYHGTFAQQDARIILRGIMDDAGYPSDELDAAFDATREPDDC